jgi:hypothetical protein
MDNFEKSYSNAAVTNQPNYDPKSPKYNLLKEASLAPFPIRGYPANGCKLSFIGRLSSDGHFSQDFMKNIKKRTCFYIVYHQNKAVDVAIGSRPSLFSLVLAQAAQHARR